MPPATILVTTNLGLYSALSAIKSTSLEGPVSILWTNICATFFPTQSGFKLAVKEAILQDDTEPDCVVVQIKMQAPDPTRSRASNQLLEKQIFMIECKRPAKDTPAEWEATAGQLSHYCELNVNGSDRIYAATAIGTKVKFWSYTNPDLDPIHHGIFDLMDAQDRDRVEQCLLHIRANGWDFTVSGQP